MTNVVHGFYKCLCGNEFEKLSEEGNADAKCPKCKQLNSPYSGIKGKLVSETKHTIVIENQKRGKCK